MSIPKFKLDEHFPVEACVFMQESGIDALTVLDQDLGGSTDMEWSSVANAESRALLTMDKGFGNILEYPPKNYSGIILFRLKNQSKPSVLFVLERLIPLLKENWVVGQLWIVDEDQIRVRS